MGTLEGTVHGCLYICPKVAPLGGHNDPEEGILRVLCVRIPAVEEGVSGT